MMAIGDAVANGIVSNETLAYFLGRIYLFAVKIGIHADKMRFRQHMGTVSELRVDISVQNLSVRYWEP